MEVKRLITKQIRIVPIIFKNNKNLSDSNFLNNVKVAEMINKFINKNIGNIKYVIPIGPPSVLMISKEPYRK